MRLLRRRRLPQVLVSYMLMLAVMTYNGAIVVTVIAGMGLGRFLFGLPAPAHGLPDSAGGGGTPSAYAPLIQEAEAHSRPAGADPAELCCPT